MTDNESNRIHADRKLLARLFSQVEISTKHFYKGTPCWEWTGHITDYGYARTTLQGHKNHLIHRITYQIFVDAIPEGLVIDHLCRVTHCVNPIHLEAVTVQTNILRGISPTAENAKKQTCKNGHELVQLKSFRGCPICIKINQAKWREEVRQLPYDHPKRVAQRESFRASNIRRYNNPETREHDNKSRIKSKEKLRQLPYDHPRKVHIREQEKLRSRKRRMQAKLNKNVI